MPPEQDYARIAFVTRRFNELQGFRTATYGAGLVLGVSHLRTFAASVSAVRFMFISPDHPVDWVVWFLILVSGAMVIEGLFDLRLTRSAGSHLTKERHADAL
jgi:hypothetical protein